MLIAFVFSNEETKGLVSGKQSSNLSIVSKIPEWIEVEELDWRERMEINAYKLVSLVPVAVTFLIYIHIFVYYIYVSRSHCPHTLSVLPEAYH